MSNVTMNANDFLNEFNKNYDAIYDGLVDYDTVDAAVSFGDEFIKTHKDFVSEFVKFRGDFLSSDREVAAFALTIAEHVN